MENVTAEKRGLVIILVIATVFLFVGLVWAIATYLPLNLSGIPSPSFTATLPRGGKNCIYPVDYWENHPERYPAQLVIGGKVYEAKEIKGIISNDTADTSNQLQSELTVTYLNFLSGADQRYIEATVFEAYGWLMQHPAGSALTDIDREAGIRLIRILKTFNQGLTEVAPCEPGLTLPLTKTSMATLTPNLLLTMMTSQTVTPTSSETPTPIELTATATKIFIYPTRTTIPTIGPTIQIPTNTPVQPTEKPTNTNTSQPPDTATFTPPPLPTSTFTPPPLPTSTFTPPPLPSPTYTQSPLPTP